MHHVKQQLILLKHHKFTFLVLLTQLFLGSVFGVVVVVVFSFNMHID